MGLRYQGAGLYLLIDSYDVARVDHAFQNDLLSFTNIGSGAWDR